MRRRLAVLSIVAAALGSTACTPEILGRVNAIDLKQILANPDLQNAVTVGRHLGQVMGGALTVILCFVCWYRATAGSPWVSVLKEYLLGTMVCVYVLASIGTPIGLDQWIYQAGQALGEMFAPRGGYLLAAHDHAVAQNVKYLVELQGAAPETPGEVKQFLQAVAFVLIQPSAVLGIVVNAVAIHFIKLVLEATYVFLVAFYWILTPIVAPTAVLPQTRHVFRGWVQSYVSVSLWPFFMGIVERIAADIPWGDWMGTAGLDLNDYAGAVTHWGQGQFMLLVLNVVFILVYLSIPVVSAKIVSGAVRSGVA
jgi:hypothetical protein